MTAALMTGVLGSAISTKFCHSQAKSTFTTVIVSTTSLAFLAAFFHLVPLPPLMFKNSQ
jgi:hypothetical protein